MKLRKIFKDCRVVGLAGAKSSGKTNNIISLLKEIPKTKRDKVYYYGMAPSVSKYLASEGFQEFDSLKQLVGKTGCLFVIDEFQKLHLNDRRNKHMLGMVIDFIYHNKNRLLLSSPSIRDFNTIIGGVVEKWILKTVLIDQCVNGSQLKKIVTDYSGRYKQLESIVVPVDELLILMMKNK